MAVRLNDEAQQSVRRIVDAATQRDGQVLGATICVVGRDGAPIFTHASGVLPRNEKPEAKREVKLSDLARMWSCGKLLATIVALQLVEDGKLDLDSPHFLEQYLPELTSKQVLSHWTVNDVGNKVPNWKPRQTPITVRMLLNHTSQLSNGFLEGDYAAMDTWYRSTHTMRDDLGTYAGFHHGLDMYYFLDEPGNFHYTGGLEWTGILLERVTGISLASLFRTRIIEPLQMAETHVIHWSEAIPDASRLFTGHIRLDDGMLVVKSIPAGTNYTGDEVMQDLKPFPESDRHAYAVSMCVFSNPKDYCKILTALLNDGTSPTTGAQILSPGSVAAMVEPQLKPERFQNRRCGDKTMLSIPLDLARLDPEGNMGLACAIQGADRMMPEGKRGCSKGTAYWYGLGNSNWWVDFKKGVAVFATTQMLPWNDPPWVAMMDQVEAAIYGGLE